MGWVYGFGVLTGLIIGMLFSAPMMEALAGVYFFAHPMLDGSGGTMRAGFR